MNTNNSNEAKNHLLDGTGSRQLLGLIRKKVKDKSPSPLPFIPSPSAFDSPVILQQSPTWSRTILWALMGVTTIAVVWASVAKIEEAIPATGKLEPTGKVKEVQAPVGGVVKAIYVSDGQQVNQGDRLVSFDPTATRSQLTSLQQIRTALLQENQFYTAVLRGQSNTPQLAVGVSLAIPPELISLTKSRTALVAENQLFKAQLGGTRTQLEPEQLERLRSNTVELNSRVAAARSQVAQLSRQLNQTNIQLASAQDTLKMNQGILNDIAPLAEDGAISRVQYLKQQQEVNDALSQVQQLSQEQARLKLEIGEAQLNVQNTLAVDRKDLLTQIANNNQQIAEIDSQLTKALVENNKRLAEVNSQLTQAKLSLQYQELTAPASGTVFELQAHAPGFVANASQPILKIVPDDALNANVFITNRDIGFVHEGMNVDVRIDSFPFSEFGDVKGKLVWIGDDALPPDAVHPFYRFPARVQLDQQYLSINNRQVALQSGMSISANIKVRSRTVISIFTDLFSKSIESLKFVR